MNPKSMRRVTVVIIGSILGAALGNVIGVSIHSDNLPFFVMLGAAIGLCFSSVVSFVIVR